MTELNQRKAPEELVEAIEDSIDIEAARAALKEKGGMTLADVRKKLGERESKVGK